MNYCRSFEWKTVFKYTFRFSFTLADQRRPTSFALVRFPFFIRLWIKRRKRFEKLCLRLVFIQKETQNSSITAVLYSSLLNGKSSPKPQRLSVSFERPAFGGHLPHRQREVSRVTFAGPGQEAAVHSSSQQEVFGLHARDVGMKPPEEGGEAGQTL